MREIKVRAWDKEAECWRYFQIGAPFTDFQSDLYERLCVMGSRFYEFTGLPDKNGNEIYESDILYDGRYYWEVFWNENHACFGIISEPTICEIIDNQNMTIVGNIWQNPDLLKKFD